MKRNKPCLIFLATILLASLALTGLARTAGLSEVNPAALYPWQVQYFGNFNRQHDPALAYASSDQLPFMSWTKEALVDNDEERIIHTIVTARPAADGIGNCGPVIDNNATWICLDSFNFQENEVALQTSSLMAVYNTDDGFLTGWIYQVNDTSSLIPLRIELLQAQWDLEGNFVSAGRIPLLALAPEEHIAFLIEDDDIEGASSLVYDNSGDLHAAVMIANSVSSEESLVYIQLGAADSSCGDPSAFPLTQCTPIVTGVNLGIFPVIKLDRADLPLVVYYDGTAVSANLAYPQPDPELMPNCGTPADPWRCIEIIRQTEDLFTIGDRPGLAIGTSARFVAYVEEAWDESEKALHIAEFVGSGGNCGEDYYRDGEGQVQIDNRWECRFVQWIDTQTDDPGDLISTTYSLQVDPQEFPVYAFTYQDLGGPSCLGVTYPAERLGGQTGEWLRNTVDCVDANSDVLAFNRDGFGFVAYVDKSNKQLWIAQQRYPIYLPVVVR